MKRICSRCVSIFSLILLILTDVAFADTLRLKDSRVIEGTLISRDQNMVLFNVNGQDHWFPTDQIVSIDLGATGTSSAQLTPATKLSSDPKTALPAEAPLGTRLVVRLSDALDTREIVTGQRFKAVLEADLVASNGTVIAPRGTQVDGHVVKAGSSRRLTGKPIIVLELIELTLNAKKKPIVTDQFEVTGDSATKGTVRRMARGALAGRAFADDLEGWVDNSDGAKAGAKVGLAASILFGKKHIEITAGTLLDFYLEMPLYN